MKQRGTVSINNILIIVITLMFISTMPLSCYADPISVVEIEKIDQQYSDNNDELMGILNQGCFINNNYLGQSFIPSQPILSSIELFIFAASDLSIRTSGMNITLCKAKLNEFPDLSNPILEIKESRDDFIGHGFDWYKFDFPDTQVEPGETYFIRVDAGRGFSWKTSYMKPGGTYDDYPNGTGWSFLMYDDYGYGDSPDFFFRTYYPYGAIVPVADAGQDQEIDYNERAFFSGDNSSDSDGEIVSYRWNFGDGTTGEGSFIGHKYSISGTYRVQLTVTDNDGLVDSDYCTVIVAEPPNQPPVPIIEIGGYLGHYYNLPCNHSEVGGRVTEIVPGDSPFNHDWYNETYYSFSRIDPDLTFGADFFPVDEGLQGDPLYFAVHWETTIIVPASGNYTFDLGSDDDSWVYIDDEMVCDLGGIHGMDISSYTVYIEEGEHELNIYFAERHRVQSGFYFEFIEEDIIVIAPVNLEEVITINANSSIVLSAEKSYDLDGIVSDFLWNFGDNNESQGPLVEHNFSVPGLYVITLTIVDDDGLSAIKEITIDVQQALVVQNEPEIAIEEIGVLEVSESSDENAVTRSPSNLWMLFFPLSFFIIGTVVFRKYL